MFATFQWDLLELCIKINTVCNKFKDLPLEYVRNCLQQELESIDSPVFQVHNMEQILNGKDAAMKEGIAGKEDDARKEIVTREEYAAAKEEDIGEAEAVGDELIGSDMDAVEEIIASEDDVAVGGKMWGYCEIVTTEAGATVEKIVVEEEDVTREDKMVAKDAAPNDNVEKSSATKDDTDDGGEDPTPHNNC